MGPGLAIFGAVVALSAPASHTQTPAPISLAPTVTELANARSVAASYWHVDQPPCGRETVTELQLDTISGEAQLDACAITFSTERDWRDFPDEVCGVYVHEFGHLVLGPAYFAASNPTDPAHSPDPLNIMYAAPDPQQHAAELQSAGCVSAIPRLMPSGQYRLVRRHRPNQQLAARNGYLPRRRLELNAHMIGSRSRKHP